VNGNQLTSLPDWLRELPALTELDLGGNQLTLLPDWLGELTALTRLDLGRNRLATLPDWLGNLAVLTRLDVSGNRLTSLPDRLGDLTALTELDLTGNRLTSLPDRLGDLTALSTLYLGNTGLTSLPDRLGDLTALSTLYLGGNQLTSLPDRLGNLSALTELDLGGNQLTTLPDWLGNLTTLTTLDLGGNQLTTLPDWLGNLTTLTRLDLGGNELTALPDWLGNLTTLTTLDLGNTGLTSLPDWLANLTILTELDVTGNQLTALPDWLANLTTLTTFYLSNTGLTSLPDWLGDLTTLTRLDLSANQLGALPEALANLTALTELQLDSTKLDSLPEWLGHLTVLARLDADSNKLTSLPESLSHLLAIDTLYLQDNQLTVLPDWLGNLTALTGLYLGGNQLTALPETIGRLTALTELSVYDNKLSALPEPLGNLVALSELNLDGNQLTMLPESVGNLTALTRLSLDDNRLTMLPESVGNLTALTELSLASNQLTTVPNSLGTLISLRLIDVRDNPLHSPLLEISEEGAAAVKAYLSLMTIHPAELWKSKLLVVGEGSVGKTSLIKALSGQQHDPNEPTTHGINIVELNLSDSAHADTAMCLSSWDFGGQDIYHATHQFFLSDRSLFLLLWNARQGWEQAKLPYWLDIIKARAPHSQIILVATHSEGRPIDLPLADLKDSYPQIATSVSVENSTGQGIDELRQVMTQEASLLPLMGSRWPSTWLAGTESINTCGKQYATPEELYELLFEAGVTDQSHQAYLLRALHLLGDILYFDDDEELRDTIILRPQWVNEYIAKVLDSPEVAARHGLLTRSHERQLWADLNPGLRDRFLLMMERFDLSYRITDDASAASLVVERLPWESPSYQEQWDAAMKVAGSHEIRLQYQLNTLPPGIPTWFIAREHRFTVGIHWRSGSLLRYNADPRVLGLIRADRQNRTVDLTVRGPVPQLFFSVLQDGFESTVSRYQGLEINRLVPCSCNQGDGTQPGQPCQHMFQYDPLLRRLEKGLPDVECELSFFKVSVADLLFGIAPTTTDQLVSRLDNIDAQLSDFRSEVAWAHRQFLKQLRRVQARAEAVCPSVFTLVPVGGVRRPGFHRLALQLYCEQPGAFHALSEPPYIINQPTRWLIKISPYLSALLSVLKHAAPLVGPVLGITAERLANQLSDETRLMSQLLSEFPSTIETTRLSVPESPATTRLEVDYRSLYAVLHELDPTDNWAGLSRTYTPEGDVLWLCREHAAQHGK
jgi:internalin A